MKRFISLALVMIMLLAMIPFSATAATASYSINIDVPEAYKAGDIVNVKITIDNVQLETGISIINFLLRYDNASLSINATSKALNCMEDFYAWEDFTTIAGSWNSDKTVFTPANDGIVDVQIGDGGGSGSDYHNIVNGESIVLNISFTAMSDASEDASVWVNGSETAALVYSDDTSNPLGYDEFEGLGNSAVVEETIEYNETAVEGGHIPGEPATCTDAQVCTGCGFEIAPSIGHDYEDVITPPDCDSQGYTTHTCGNCGDEYTDSYVNASGHDYEDIVIPPTCTEGGYTIHTCGDCGDEYTDSETDPAHSYIHVTTAPSCTEQGYTTHTCENCGDEYVDSYVDAIDHTPGDWTTVTPPQIGVEGLEEKCCSVCGTQLDTRPIDALKEPQYILGDANNDGKLTATDYMMIKKIVFNTLSLDSLPDPETALLRCDLSGDGKITAIDYLRVKKLILS